MGRRRGHIKVHFAVNVETGEVIAMEITMNDTHDYKAFKKLQGDAERHGNVVKVYGDGAYDSLEIEIYELLDSRGIEAAIKPRKNSRSDTPSEARRKTVSLYRNLGHQTWA